MVEHSCYKYSEYRISMLCKLIYFTAVVCGVMNKGYCSTVQIMMLIEYSDAGWIIHLFNCFGWFQ
jgi:hypothetical protein